MSSAITGLDLDQQLPSLKLGRPRESRFEVKARRVVHILRRARGKGGGGEMCLYPPTESLFLRLCLQDFEYLLQLDVALWAEGQKF